VGVAADNEEGGAVIRLRFSLIASAQENRNGEKKN